MTCEHCGGRGYHNVRASGPAALRGGWKRRPCACVAPKARAAPPRRELVATPPDIWEPLWLEYLHAAAGGDPRKRIHGSPAGLLAVRNLVLGQVREAIAAMPENAMRAEALAAVDKMEARG